MLVIGLTGGIGTGKSEAARLLGERGAVVVSADKLGHEAYRRQTRGWDEVVAAFGTEVLTPSGEIDREKLGRIVFADQARLEVLNRIVHPLIGKAIQEQVRALAQRRTAAVVVEAALLMEAGWDAHVDEIWVTVASEDVAVQRVAAQGRMTEMDVRARVRSQMAEEHRVERAAVVIDNNKGLEELGGQVARLWRQRVDQQS